MPNNPAHKFSDQYVNISIIERDKVLKIAQELEIDGIMSFACDPGVVTAAYVAEKMGLPSVGSYASVSILQNKGMFREFLKKHGFNTPEYKSFRSKKTAFKSIGLFNWPVIVKPTDSAGSKGVSKVDDISKLSKAIDLALDYSHSNEFIIEEFLEQKGFASDCDSFVVNGKVVCYGFNSQRFDKEAENPFTPAAYSWPSTISKQNINHLKKEIQRLITLLNMKTSVFNIEVRECIDGKPYIMELTPRGGGNRLSEMMKIVTGIDMIDNAVRFALGEELIPYTKNKSHFFLAEIVLHSKKPGVFRSLVIDESLKNNIMEIDLWVDNNTRIGGFKGANEAIGTLVLRFEEKDKMEEIMDNQSKYVRVIVD